MNAIYQLSHKLFIIYELFVGRISADKVVTDTLRESTGGEGKGLQ